MPGWSCYVGDDLGDLAAFDTLDRLRAAGLATLAVCSGSIEAPEVPELAARADLVVDGPHAVADFLERTCGHKKNRGRELPCPISSRPRFPSSAHDSS